jgi:thymidylate synthase
MKSIRIEEDYLPFAWEKAVKECWRVGDSFPTEYDKPNDPNSRDVVAIIHVKRPFAEPRIHRAFPGGLDDLEKYRSEVLHGVHDHWVNPAEGKWEYCVGGDTEVLLSDYSSRTISQCKPGDQVLSLNISTGKLEPAKIVQTATCKTFPYKMSVEYNNGCHEIEISSVHPLYVLGKGWTKAKDIAIGDKVAVGYGERDFLCRDVSSTVICNEEDIRKIQDTIQNINIDRSIDILKKLKLIPFNPSSRNGQIVITLLGYLFGDGWLETPFSKETSAYLACRIGFGGEYSALRTIKKLLNAIGFSSGKIVANRTGGQIKGRDIRGTSLHFSCNHTALWCLMKALGCPIGCKTINDYSLPKWLMSSSDTELIKCFLEGFSDAEMSAPFKSRKNEHNFGVGAQIYFRQNKHIELQPSLEVLISQFKELFSRIGIRFADLHSIIDEDSASMGLRIGDRKNVDTYLDAFSYQFSFNKHHKSELYKRYRNYCYDRMATEEAENLSHIDIISFSDFCIENINGVISFGEVSEILKEDKEIEMYDIAVNHKDHNFIGNGIFCHNTYHQRLFEYELPGYYPKEGTHAWPVFNQIEKCIEMLKKAGHTRRAQAITWKVWEDLGISDPACLQRLWFRVENCDCGPSCTLKTMLMETCPRCEGEGKVRKLNMVASMRSNDAYKAAFMNMYAFTELQAYVADRIGVEPGEYCHIVDSFHIYGSYFNEVEAFVNSTRKDEDKVFDTSFCIPFFIEGCEILLKEEDMPLDKKNKVEERLAYLKRVQ